MDVDGPEPWCRPDCWSSSLCLPSCRRGVPRAVILQSPVNSASRRNRGRPAGTADLDESITPRFLVARGYAVAGFNVRGTGGSGGCLEFFGPKEQRDQAVLVEWLAAQPWSNGRV